MQDFSGRKLGQYELRERLGRGGMAEVYKAYQPGLDRFVAVKVMLAQLADDESFIERFRREARAVGSLRHAHIVQVFDFGIEDDVYYMAMEYIQGVNLKALIVREGKLSVEAALRTAAQLADALAYAHQAGMIHRDMKPANVMFLDEAYQHAILTDFGIARIMGQAGLTGTGMAVGTPDYMSPEAGRGDTTDHRSDIYALGIILYEMLVGEVPYSADTPLAVVMKHINAPLPTYSDYGDAIPEYVERIILRCMAKDPADRYDDAAKLHDALQEALKETTNSARTEANPTAPTTESPARSRNDITKEGSPTMIAQPDTRTEQIPVETARTGLSPLQMGLAAIAVLVVIALIAYLVRGGTGESAADATSTPQEVAISAATVAPTAAPADAPTTVRTGTEDIWGDDDFSGIGGVIYKVELPPDPDNLNILSGISSLMDSVDSLVIGGSPVLALSNLNTSLNSDPDNADVLFVRSQFHSMDYDEETLARVDAQHMIELDPENVWGYVAEADSYLVYPDYDTGAAQQSLERAHELDPENPQVMWRRVLFSHYDQQLEDFDDAEGSGARGWRFIIFAGDFLYDNREYERAIPYLAVRVEQKLGGEYPIWEGRWKLMGSLMQTGQDGIALDLAQQFVGAITDNESEAYGNLAFVAYNAEEYEQALQWANTALALDGNNHAAAYLLALLTWHFEDNLEAALQQFEALQNVEDLYSFYLNFDYEFDYRLDQARILMDAGQAEAALPWYDAVLEEWGSTAWLYEERADAYLEIGDTEAAREDLQRAMENTEDADYRQELLQRIVELGPAPTRQSSD